MRYGVFYYDVALGAECLWIYPEENHFELGKLIFWQDEYAFCQRLLDDIQKGNAVIEIKSGSLILQLGSKENREILLQFMDVEEEMESEALKNTLEKVKRGKLKMKAEIAGVHYGVFSSVAISFHKSEAQKNIKLNKKEENKRKKSTWRNPTKPKDKNKHASWERIFRFR